MCGLHYDIAVGRKRGTVLSVFGRLVEHRVKGVVSGVEGLVERDRNVLVDARFEVALAPDDVTGCAVVVSVDHRDVLLFVGRLGYHDGVTFAGLVLEGHGGRCGFAFHHTGFGVDGRNDLELLVTGCVVRRDVPHGEGAIYGTGLGVHVEGAHDVTFVVVLCDAYLQCVLAFGNADVPGVTDADVLEEGIARSLDSYVDRRRVG